MIIMNKQKQLELTKKIEADDAIFASLDNAGKIVKIAEDCIQRIRMKQISTYPGSFLEDVTENKADSLKCLLNTNSKFTCQSCAKGGLFLSYVGRVNDFSVGQIQYGNDIRNNEHVKLLEIFTIEQLALIEYAFEGIQHLGGYVKNGQNINIQFDDKTENKVKKFFKKYGGIMSELDFITTYERVDLVDFAEEELFKVKQYFKNSDKRLIAICQNLIKNNGTFVL